MPRNNPDAFNIVGLHTIMLGVFASNRRAVRTYEKAGFQKIGRRRQSYFADGQMQDEIWMDCLASEFEGDKLRSNPSR